jgi:TPR repeat protein
VRHSMFVCYVCGKENLSESAKFCNECGPTKKWEASDVDLPDAVEQYTLFYSEIYFEHSADEAEKMSVRVREKNKVSAQTHKKIAQALAEQKKSIEHLSQFMLEFDENVVDAYAGGDTYLKFRFKNLSDDEFYKVNIEWDDQETSDDQDLKISSKSFVKPDSVAILGGSHIFSRMGIKEISDLMITVSDQSQQSATFRASTFNFKVNNPDQRVTQNFSTTNQISIEGRGVVDNSGNSAEKNFSAASQSSDPKWVRLNCVYVPSSKPLVIQPSSQNMPQEEQEISTNGKASLNNSEFDSNDLQSIINAAEAGNIKAIHQLGREYMNGGKVDKNYARALECFMKAAYQDYAPSQVNIGVMYSNGWGVTEDQAMAFDWYTKSAKQNNATAQLNIGNCYMYGWGVTEDPVLAIEWFRKAAAQKNGNANRALGWAYRDGIGVEVNPVEAKKYFEVAIDCGLEDATVDLASLYLNGQGVIKDPKIAAELYLKMAYKGNSIAQYCIAHQYFSGNGVPQDYHLALEFATKSANSGNSDAQYLVGHIYSDEDFEEMDSNVAIEWFKKASENGHPDAEQMLQSLMQSVKPSNEYQCNSPAMDECLFRLMKFLEIFEDLRDDPCPYRIFNSSQLDSDLIDSITASVQESSGWNSECFYGLVIEDEETVTTSDDGETYDGFEGAATVIYKYGFVTITAIEGTFETNWSMAFNQAEPATLNFISWDTASRGIYLRTGKNLAVAGLRWDYSDDVSMNEHLETINNANSWLNRAFAIAKGEIDRDEVLFPTEEESESGDEEESPQYIPCKSCDNINELGDSSCPECGVSLDDAIVLRDGSTYYGKLDENHLCTGFATCIFESGDKYVGTYFNGFRNGHGVYTWANGEIYDGNWVNNLRHGNGVRTLPDGTKTEGEWVDDIYQEKKKSGFFSALKEGFKEGYEGKK